MRHQNKTRERILDHAEKLEAERERLDEQCRRLHGENRRLRAKLAVAEAALRASNPAAFTACADCGETGELTGHMTCQYPQDR